ncbi:MAG: hypothetical protein A3J58_00510 [Candidatus Sungbacteria bacterium RIFCSPHIGHO2_02_FULL_52_23]|uniref:RecF/RecN/SMC N-terminal domain-containing protein n=1 Tax=Candidatus Sungbacteria bacterium RIFCSPHIGHO2_02_FULL_52_23 TaxID=1802274 RepID=A0A1G2KSN0_9BACT|nr:MAG: hypothetical protein A3J58_00510 [Candidatus Sungbacteria bacterium RIFCSPHIGHO2_02_FULL_52_23]
MYLKKLEISGFKSFAKTTVLEFPSRIVAVVGPNGSGKSNIAESIRWVLGEQSMKMLRGKKGEDLIWNGSAETPRMGKASVTLFFDNRDGAIPIEFDEVALGRKIFRDGSNEYLLNGSAVRLKDVVELGARLGLGEAKHNLIGQGEVDRILLAGARDRREMLEEALGLRVYQLKKNEAERKLDATVRNLEQVEGLLREITPHLKFLKTQARRAEMRGEMTRELAAMQAVYFVREERAIAADVSAAAKAAAPLLEKRDLLKREIRKAEQEIVLAERTLAPAKPEERIVSKLGELQERRREYERELGRLEGKRDAGAIARPAARPDDMRDLGNEMRQFINEVRAVIEDEEDSDALRAQLRALLEDIESVLDDAEGGGRVSHGGESHVGGGEFDAPIRALQEKLALLGDEIAKAEQLDVAMREASRTGYETIRAQDMALRALRDQEREVMLALERLKFEEGRLHEREEVYAHEWREMGHDGTAAGASEDYPDMPQEELRRKIERMRLKLEEIGGIDESIAKEYEETETRHAFLERELGDLKSAHASLKTLIKELDTRVRQDFKEGFAKIKSEFHDYFKIIFNGGSARLSIVRQETSDKEASEGMEGEEKNEEEGIEIDVDLPRKRIKGLAMLSGGERALTAVALLFAIAAVNPPPFLVLDETDAALDEANSRRYASILQELAKKTQLVVITHNRETMQCAGVLYGVTMGDDGTSRLLSLKLEDAKEYTNR